MSRVVAAIIDLAPGWIWKPANLRFVGSHELHFCFGHDGRRTIEWDGRKIASGRRQWHTGSDQSDVSSGP
jgi:hypothetical protein